MSIPPPLDARQPVTARDLAFEKPPVPTAQDVRAIRERLGYSQAVFASALGVDLGTVRNWEQGKRQVAGAARRLLQAIEAQPRLLSFWVESGKNGRS
jgi:putative transcriptional regulator